MRRLSNLRLRFTLFYGAALVLTVALFSAGIYYFVQRTLIGQIDNHLRKDLDTVVEYLHSDPDGLPKLASMGPVDFFRIRDGNRPLLATSEWDKTGLDKVLDGGNPAAAPVSLVAGNQRLYRVQSRIEPVGEHLHQILVAHEEEGYRKTLNAMALIILLILPILSASSLLVGYLISGRVLAPITAITDKAQEINAENLSERLPVGDDDNEFSRLATVFNQTFVRLQGSFERLRRFTSDASHELRTPLTAIRSIGETALQRQSVNHECRETIGSMLEEADRLVQTVESLLLLSRADVHALHKETTEVGDLLADVIDFLSVLAEEKQQQISFERSTSLTMPAEPCMLRRAFLNILDNAIKYSPEQSAINVRFYRQQPDTALIEITDKGPGIPDAEKTHIFDRFYRLDTGRSREKGGAGLGLAISKAAIEVHGGTICLQDAPGGGTIFKVLFPVDTR